MSSNLILLTRTIVILVHLAKEKKRGWDNLLEGETKGDLIQVKEIQKEEAMSKNLNYAM